MEGSVAMGMPVIDRGSHHLLIASAHGYGFSPNNESEINHFHSKQLETEMSSITSLFIILELP